MYENSTVLPLINMYIHSFLAVIIVQKPFPVFDEFERTSRYLGGLAINDIFEDK